MALRMDFNIFWGPLKNPTFRGEFTKTNIEGGLPKKKRAWTVCQFDGELCKKEDGDVFDGGGEVDTTIHTMLERYQLKC